MANLNPETRSDYRDHPEPKLRTRDLLIWMVEYDAESYTSRDIASHFRIEVADSASRLAGLKKWGCMRVIKKGRGNQPSFWEVTDWGLKMAEKWKVGR